MNAAGAIKLARIRAQLSKRELARRAATSPAAIVHYESGERAPTYPTLERIVAAAGYRTVLDIECTRPNRRVASERLQQVLELAEHLPHRPPARTLSYPPLPRR
jgi:transcriptional regulator with XRE-family HTH domain